MTEITLSGPAQTDLPAVFLPYQQRLSAAIAAHPVVVVEKSRRTGYSWAVAADAALTASASRAAGGMDVLYMGYEKDMTREFIDYVAMWAKSVQPAAAQVEEFLFRDPDRPDGDILAFRVKFASGFEVIALPSVPRALRGKQGMVILDEAAFHDDLDAVLKAAFALLIWGGKVVVISTHNGDTNPFNVLVQDIRAGRAPYHLQRLTFDQALEEGLYKRICLTTGREWSPEAEAAWKKEISNIYRDNADEELNVVPNPSTGTFIPGPLIEARMGDGAVLRWEGSAEFNLWREPDRQRAAEEWIAEELAPVLAGLDPKCPHVFGFDIARRGDLTVIWVLAIGADMVRRTPLVIEMRTMPFAQQKQVLWHMVEHLPRRRGGAMDATGLGMQIAEETVEKFGASVLAVMLTEPWYREHMPPLKAAFEDNAIAIPRDRDTAGDIRLLKLVRGVARVPERVRDDAGRQRHGDAAIALALAYHASRADPEIYEYQGRRAEAAARGWAERAEELDNDSSPERGLLPQLREKNWQ